MTKSAVQTAKAPAAVGPYSQAIQVGDLVFLSGQIPLVPETGEMQEGCIVCQTERVLSNFQAVLEAAGLGWDDVVKTTVFLTDISVFSQFNELYAAKFASDPPARSVVQISALPKGAQIEMEGIAVRR